MEPSGATCLFSPGTLAFTVNHIIRIYSFECSVKCHHSALIIGSSVSNFGSSIPIEWNRSNSLPFLRNHLSKAGFSDDTEFVGSAADQIMTVPGS